MQKYWVCWNKKRGAFNVEHECLEYAKAESFRLVLKHGEPIDILECVGQSKTYSVPVVYEEANSIKREEEVYSNAKTDMMYSEIIPGGCTA